MSEILVVSGHTDLENSFANKIILGELKKHLPEAKFDILSELYKNYAIDVKAEQEKLVKADMIVLVYPFFWYGVPSLLQKWLEDVLVHGFSHGSKGDKLHGKKLVLSFTSGAPEELYKKDALQRYEIEEFLPPLKALANTCGMEFAGYVYSGGLSYQSRHDEAKLALMKQKALDHAKRLGELIGKIS